MHNFIWYRVIWGKFVISILQVTTYLLVWYFLWICMTLKSDYEEEVSFSNFISTIDHKVTRGVLIIKIYFLRGNSCYGGEIRDFNSIFLFYGKWQKSSMYENTNICMVAEDFDQWTVIMDNNQVNSYPMN